MGIKFKNNAVTTLATEITSSATVITVAVGTGDKLPVAGNGDYFYGTLLDLGGNEEIVKVVERVGDTLTVERGAEETIPRPFPVSSRIENRITAQSMYEAGGGGGTPGTDDYLRL